MRSLNKCFKYVHKFETIFCHRKSYSSLTKPPWRIMFFGTDTFSLSSLKCLNHELKKGKLISNLEIVTSLRAKLNPVHSFAKEQNLSIHGWPVALTEGKFDIGIVVSFGHLIPDEIINKFHLGIINVHASLLPRWRGAAPIIHSIAHGDRETGVTIMKIQPKKFDIGEIIKQSCINVPENILMPDLYNQLADLGATTLVSCLRELPEALVQARPQPQSGITYAPKVSPAMAQISWEKMSARQVYALARALHGLYPLATSWNNTLVKLYEVSLAADEHVNSIRPGLPPGSVEFHKQTDKLLIKCEDGRWVSCGQIGLPAKKPMTANDFNNGYVKKEPVNKRLFK